MYKYADVLMFDTHGHYDDKVFDEDREELLLSMKRNGVGWIVNVGAELSGCREALRLAEKYDFAYAAFGVHPSETAELTEADLDWMRENAAHGKVVAIGEFGLDYHWPEPASDIQKKWFVRQIALAKETGLPILIHSRDAAKDTMEILTAEKAYDCGGVIHCYSYSPEMAKEYVKMGFYIGIGGVVTFKNAKKCKQTVEQIPLGNIVLETDCPYLSPEPHRGERNDSTKMIYVAEEIAAIKGIEPEEVIRVTTENAHKLYRLD